MAGKNYSLPKSSHPLCEGLRVEWAALLWAVQVLAVTLKEQFAL